MKLCPRCSAAISGDRWQCPACDWQPAHRSGFATLAPELAEAGGGFDPAAFAVLSALEDRNFWFRARNRLILWALKRWQPGTQRHLEVGCGTGYVLAAVSRAFPQARVTGTEVFVAGLPYAAARVGDGELLQMDARQIPYADEFDTIGAFDVIEHIEEDERVLSQIARALRAGGVLLLTVPQHRWLWSTQDELARHVRRYTARELREKVTRTGLQVEFETSFVSLLLPLMALSRLRRRGRVEVGLAGSDELDPPRWLGSALETIMNFELRLISLGFRFPAGGSRMLIARKRKTEK